MAQYEIIRPRKTNALQRWVDSLRSLTLGPWNPRDPAIARYFGGGSVSAGVSVNETTAMNYSAVWAAVNLISGHIGSVPLEFYKRAGDGKEKFRNHKLYRILHDRPNSQMGSALFRRTLQAHKLIWGNGYAEIERDNGGDPVALWPLLPYAVTPYVERGELRYRVQNPGRDDLLFAANDIIHVRGLSDDGICGMSAIRCGRESLGLSIAAERFGAMFFGNGSTFGGVISYPAGAGSNEKTRKENREALEKQHQGPDRAHRFLALYEGAKYERLGIPPDDAQFLETRQFQIEEIARWFNLPPHKLKDLRNATYSNIEQQSIEYVTDTLDPHWVEWEEELTMKLIRPLEQQLQIIEFNREGLKRGDSVSRSELQSKQFSLGGLTPNELRGQENRNPIENGDDAFVSLQNIPLDMVRDYWQASIDKMKAPPPAPVAPKPDVNPNDAEMKALREALELARGLAQKAEDLQAKAEAELTTEKMDHESTRAELTSANADVLKATAEVEKWCADSLRDTQFINSLTVERDALTARVALVEADYQRVCGERDSSRAADAATTLALDCATGREQELRASIVVLTAERDDAMGGLEIIKGHLAMAEEGCAALRQQLDAARTAHEADKAEHGKALEVLHGFRRDAEAERDAVKAELDAVNAELASERTERAVDGAAHEKALADAIAAHEYTRTISEGLGRQREENYDRALTAEADRDTALTLAAQTEQEKAAVLATVVLLQAERDDATTQAGEAKNLLDAQAVRVETLEKSVQRIEAEAETLKTDLARARADIASELEKQRTQKGVLLAAMRSLFVDASERLLQKESDRARKHQATPEKLRAWIGSFYPLHADVCRSVFQPLVGPWTAITGGAPNLLLDELVNAHIEASRSAMTLVADADDPDQMAASLERTLYRWEHERADAMADALVREGMAA